MADTEGLPGSEPSGRGGRYNRDIIRLVVASLALVLLIAFVVDNAKPVEVGFIFFHHKVSLIWAILIAAVLGAVVDRLAIFVRARQKRSRARRS